MTIGSVLVVGVGSIGGWLLARLTQNGAAATGLARGEAYRQLASGVPLVLDSHQGDWSGPVEVVERPTSAHDLVVVAVKSTSTGAVGRALPQGSRILCAQNGVENAQTLQAMGHDATSAVVRSGAQRIGPTHVRHTSNGYLVMEDQEIAEYLNAHGVDCRLVPDIERELWLKLMGNLVSNTLCAIVRAPLGEVLSSPALAPVVSTILDEGLAVARAEGIDLPDDAKDQVIAGMGRIPPENRPSTLQDLEAGRPLEVDALTGVVVRKAREHGLPHGAVATVDGLLRHLADR